MKNLKLCEDILKNVGGKKNIQEVTHCMTRLRIALNDPSKANLKALDILEGVMGAVEKGGQIQIIIGNEINSVYSDFIELVGEGQTLNEKPKGKKIENLLNTISAIFNPIVPALAGAGMIKALLVVLKLTNLIDASSNTYAVINTLSDSVFTFLPFLLAYSSAKKFKCNPYIAVALAGTLMHPNFTSMIAEGNAQIDFFGIPLNLMNYASSVFPIILGVLLMSYVEKGIDKIMPSAFKIIFVPALTLLISAPIVLLSVGPFAEWVGMLIADGVTVLFDKGGIFAGFIYGGIYSTMVVTGLHHGMVPVLVSGISTVGYNTISPASGSANMAQAGSAFAVWLKSKNTKTKAVAAGATISAVLGVTEPAIYGVNLRLKKPFLSAAVGGACGGAFAAAFGCRAYAMGGPSFATIAMFIGDDGGKWIYVLIAFAIAFIVAAVITFILGFEEIPLEEDTPATQEELVNAIQITAPVSGEMIPLVDVPDPTFAKGIIGQGFAIEPNMNEIYAPISGTIVTLFKTGHAIGIVSDLGAEILIHIGIDTVKLNGEYFDVKVKQGDMVHEGDLLVRIDREKIRANGFSCTTMVVVTNKAAFPKMRIIDQVNAKHGDSIMRIAS